MAQWIMRSFVSQCKSEESGSTGDEPAKPKESLVKEDEAGTHESDGEVKAKRAAENAESDPDDDEEETEPEIEVEVKSAPYDHRFPTTNQARHCYTRYNEFYRCKNQKSEDDEECKFYQKAYRAICPGEWVEKWNEQRESGTWAGKY